MNVLHNIGIAQQVGKYGDAIEVPPHARWLMTAGTPGLAPDGTLPDGMTAQAEQAWSNIIDMLQRAGMSVDDLVKVTQYVTRESDIPAYVQVRSRVLGDARPASMLLVTPAFVRPEFLVEIDVVAAKA